MEDAERVRFLLLLPRLPRPLPVLLPPPPLTWGGRPAVAPRPVAVLITDTVVAASSLVVVAGGVASALDIMVIA